MRTALLVSHASTSQKQFAPSDLGGGLLIHLDASEPTSLWVDLAKTDQVAGEEQFRVIADLSGNGYDFVQSNISLGLTYDADGINGRPAASNTATGWLRRATTPANAQPYTVFMVAKHTAVVASSFFLDGGGGTTNRSRINLNASSQRGINAGTALGYAAAADTTAHIHEAVFDGTGSEYLIDGTLDAAGNSGAVTLEGLTLFASRAGAGIPNAVFGEMVVVTGAMTALERLQMRRYLSGKWGIALGGELMSLSASAGASRFASGQSYDAATELSAVTPKIEFKHLYYEVSSSPATAVIEDVASGNTTRSMMAFSTDSPYIEIPVISQFKNNWVVFENEVAIGHGATFPTAEDDGTTYIVRLQFPDSRSRAIWFGARGQALGVDVPAGYELDDIVAQGAPTQGGCLLIGDSWTQGTGAAADTDDPFGNSQPGTPWLSGPQLLSWRLLLNALNRGVGGSGWVNQGSADNFLERITTELATGTFTSFLLIGSGNDKAEDLETVASNLTDGIALCRAHDADAPILVVGPGWWELEPGETWQPLEDIMASTVAGLMASDDNLLYVSVKEWMGAENVNQPTYIHTGGSHPTTTGHAAWCDYVFELCRDFFGV